MVKETSKKFKETNDNKILLHFVMDDSSNIVIYEIIYGQFMVIRVMVRQQ